MLQCDCCMLEMGCLDVCLGRASVGLRLLLSRVVPGCVARRGVHKQHHTCVHHSILASPLSHTLLGEPGSSWEDHFSGKTVLVANNEILGFLQIRPIHWIGIHAPLHLQDYVPPPPDAVEEKSNVSKASSSAGSEGSDESEGSEKEGGGQRIGRPFGLVLPGGSLNLHDFT